MLDPEPRGHVGGADLHVVDLACAQARGGRYRPHVLLLTQAPRVAERLRAGGVEVVDGHRLGGRYTALPFRLSRPIRDFQPHLLHAHGYDANYFACWARLVRPRAWSGRPLLVTSHGWINRPSLWVKTSLDLVTHRFADHVIVCSPHQRERARSAAGHDSITFVPNGVPEERCSPVERAEAARRFGLPADGRLVAFVGRLSEEKQVDVFLAAAAAVAPELPDVHFVIAGGGPLEAWVRSRLSGGHLAGRVTMTGVVWDIDAVYRHVDVLVVPSRTETTSRVTLEAMMWGIPVIASDVGGMPHLITSGSDGFLCPPGDVAAFARRLRQLLTAPEEGLRIGARGRAKARALWTVERMRLATEEVYDAVLAG